jgi:hypothetical protein
LGLSPASNWARLFRIFFKPSANSGNVAPQRNIERVLPYGETTVKLFIFGAAKLSISMI